MRQTTFMQIFSDLHGAISDGTLLPGMPLPSENTLAQQYSTSRPTVRKAIKMLSEQSLIVRKQGIGSVVAEKKQEKPLIFGLDLELQSYSIANSFRRELETVLTNSLEFVKTDCN